MIDPELVLRMFINAIDERWKNCMPKQLIEPYNLAMDLLEEEYAEDEPTHVSKKTDANLYSLC